MVIPLSSSVTRLRDLPRPVHAVQGAVGTAQSILPFAEFLREGNNVPRMGRIGLQSTNKTSFVPFSQLLSLERQLETTRDELERYKEAALRPSSSEEPSPRTFSNGLPLEYAHITEQTLESVTLSPNEIFTLINQ